MLAPIAIGLALVTALCGLSACAAPDRHPPGSEPTVPTWPLRTVQLAPTETGPMQLTHVGDRFAAVRLERDGGEVRLPAGSWQLTLLDAPPGTPPIAVPAFTDISAGTGAGLDEVLRIPTALPPPGDDEFATIPAGPALLGDRLGVGQPDERPARIVHLPVFQLGRGEVSNDQFVAFLNAAATEIDTGPWLDLRNRKCRIERGDDGSYTTDAPDLPVVTVSWQGAVAYCAWRSDAEGRRYRLPSEAEWEKAARGPGSHVYSYGDIYTPGAANQESGRIKPVASYPPNAWGLFDLTGNAFEWTADDERGPASQRQGDTPIDAPAAVDASLRRCLRGGSFVLDGIFLRNSFRMLLRPTVRADDVGFRLLREIPGKVSDRSVSELDEESR